MGYLQPRLFRAALGGGREQLGGDVGRTAESGQTYLPARARRCEQAALDPPRSSRRRATWLLSVACGFNRRVLPTPRWVRSPATRNVTPARPRLGSLLLLALGAAFAELPGSLMSNGPESASIIWKHAPWLPETRPMVAPNVVQVSGRYGRVSWKHGACQPDTWGKLAGMWCLSA